MYIHIYIYKISREELSITKLLSTTGVQCFHEIIQHPRGSFDNIYHRGLDTRCSQWCKRRNSICSSREGKRILEEAETIFERFAWRIFKRDNSGANDYLRDVRSLARCLVYVECGDECEGLPIKPQLSDYGCAVHAARLGRVHSFLPSFIFHGSWATENLPRSIPARSPSFAL